MPFGYVISVGVMAAGLLFALAPLRRSGSPGIVSWLFSAVVNESPFVAFYYLAAATLLAFAQDDLATPLGWVGLALVGLSMIGFPIIVRRTLRARPAVARALDSGLGAGWRSSPDSAAAARLNRRLTWARILLAPIPVFPRGVERRANISYGDAGRSNLLDVYRSRSHATPGPILIHLHGGYFVTGRKSFEARPLLHRLARQGWVCVSANYRLRPAATFPDYLIDVKKVIAWARDHAHEYGADRTLVFVAGSSAGAHLAATAALTPNDPAFQPGFEQADTSVTAAIGLYGYYGPVDRTRQPLPSSPRAYVRPDSPPMLIAHGDQDTFVTPEHARRFADELRSTSANPVVYVELPGGQHSFDLFHSIRFETLINGIEAFAASVASPRSSRRSREGRAVSARGR
ncbi:MAG: alpha/beta hydrolase [Gaiellaceae bacterium]